MLIELLNRYPQLAECQNDLKKATAAMIDCYKNGGKIMLCGNGGSCADCDHIVGELMKGFLKKRPLSNGQKAEMINRSPLLAKYKQHRYMFLTKNPGRYKELAEAGLLPTDDNMFYGTTITDDETEFFFSDKHKTFLSIEPIQKEFSERKLPPPVDWVIIGQETGNRKDKIIADAGWIEKIYNVCHSAGIPVFMKDNLSGIVENLRQESAT